jgi:tetratricopeptide (TPR) repeat protein
LLDSINGDDRLEVLTQVARACSLQEHWDEANRILDEVEGRLENAGPCPRIRYFLERGRVFNSRGDREQARGFFIDAWQESQSVSEEGLAVDAAHMVAITYSGMVDAIEWNQRGLLMAQSSQDPKARGLIPAILNNSAWDLYDLGRYEEALPLFESALVAWTASAQPNPIQIAKWSVAHCLLALGRNKETLSILLALKAEQKETGLVDIYVLEEMEKDFITLGYSE